MRKESKVDQQLAFLEEKVSDWNQTDKKRFVLLNERLLSYLQYVESYKAEKEFQEQTFANNLSALEARIAQKFMQERQADQEMEKRLTRLIADKFNGLRQKLGDESRERFDVLENLKVCLENDFPKLALEIKQEVKARERGDGAVMQKIKEEVSKVQDLINAEKKTRTETEEAVAEVLREMVNKVRKDLEAEKANRL